MSSSSSLASSSKPMIKKTKLEMPDDDVNPYIPSKYKCFTKEQTRHLTIQYLRSPLDCVDFAKLMGETGLTRVQISKWFSRRRMKDENAERAARINNVPPPPRQLNMTPPPPPQMALLPPPPPLINLPPPLPPRIPMLPPQPALQQFFAAYYNLLMQTNQLQNPRLTAPDVNHSPTLPPPPPVSSFFANPFYSSPSMNTNTDAFSFYTPAALAAATSLLQTAFYPMNSAPSLALVIQQAIISPHYLGQASASNLQPHFHTSGMAGYVQMVAPDFVNGHNYQEEISDDEIIDVEN